MRGAAVAGRPLIRAVPPLLADRPLRNDMPLLLPPRERAAGNGVVADGDALLAHPRAVPGEQRVPGGQRLVVVEPAVGAGFRKPAFHLGNDPGVRSWQCGTLRRRLA